MTGRVTDAHGLGRVIRGERDKVRALVQEGELLDEQRLCLEINFGAYVFDRQFMAQWLPRLEKHAGGEYYLTDLVEVAVKVHLAGKASRSHFRMSRWG